MEVEEIEAQLDNNDFNSNEIYGLAGLLRSDREAKKKGYERITDDDIERINVTALLLQKLEQSPPKQYHVHLDQEDYKKFGDVYSKVKAMIKALELEDIIDYVSPVLGGAYYYHVAQRDKYRDYLYNQIRFVIRKVKQPKKGQITPKDIAIQEEVNDLKDFKLFVEKDGFLAFWNNSAVGKELKNHVEEIARAEFMAFLAGEGIFIKGSQFREIPEGAGYSDVVRIEQSGTKRLFELKVISKEKDRFKQGLAQLFDYMSKEDVSIGYYVIFDARHPDERKEAYEQEYTKGSAKILVTVIDIYPIAPTRKPVNEK